MPVTAWNKGSLHDYNSDGEGNSRAGIGSLHGRVNGWNAQLPLGHNLADAGEHAGGVEMIRPASGRRVHYQMVMRAMGYDPVPLSKPKDAYTEEERMGKTSDQSHPTLKTVGEVGTKKKKKNF